MITQTMINFWHMLFGIFDVDVQQIDYLYVQHRGINMTGKMIILARANHIFLDNKLDLDPPIYISIYIYLYIYSTRICSFYTT